MKKAILTVTAVMMIFALASCGTKSVQTEKSKTTATTQQGNTAIVTSRNQLIMDTELKNEPAPVEDIIFSEGKRKVIYPKLKLPDNKNIDKINDMIKQCALYKQFYSDNEDVSQDFKYEIKYYDKSKISIVFSGFYYAMGEAHPNNFKNCINIDLNTGELIPLSNFVKIDKAYADKVKSELRSQFINYINTLASDKEPYDYFKDENVLEWLNSEGMGKTILQRFYFTEDSLVISFDTIYALGDHFEVVMKK